MALLSILILGLAGPVLFPAMQLFFLWRSAKRDFRKGRVQSDLNRSDGLRKVSFADIRNVGIGTFAILVSGIVVRLYGQSTFEAMEDQFLRTVFSVGWSHLVLMATTIGFGFWCIRMWLANVDFFWCYPISGWIFTRLIWHWRDVLDVGSQDFENGEAVVYPFAWMLAASGVAGAVSAARLGASVRSVWLWLALAAPFIALQWTGTGGTASLWHFDALYSLGVWGTTFAMIHSKMIFDVKRDGGGYGVDAGGDLSPRFALSLLSATVGALAAIWLIPDVFGSWEHSSSVLAVAMGQWGIVAVFAAGAAFVMKPVERGDASLRLSSLALMLVVASIWATGHDPGSLDSVDVGLRWGLFGFGAAIFGSAWMFLLAQLRIRRFIAAGSLLVGWMWTALYLVRAMNGAAGFEPGVPGLVDLTETGVVLAIFFGMMWRVFGPASAPATSRRS